MTWMRVEQGRSVNTLMAYRRDIDGFVDWLKTQEANVMNATSQHI
ncbi:MAG: site-specific integrase, partial [Ilumatobacteraceae bacterium]